MKAFEEIKSTFGQAGTSETFPLPLNLRRGRRACTLPYFDPHMKHLILSTEDIQQLFDPVISKIAGLINSQIMAADRECGSPVTNVSIHSRGQTLEIEL